MPKDKAAERRAHRQDIKERMGLVGAEPRFDEATVMKLARELSGSRRDGWANLISGLGIMGRDKRTATGLKWTGLLMREHQVEETLAGSNLARRVIELLPYEATREPLKFKNLNEQEKDVQAELDRLNMRANFFQGWCWGRGYGGAGVLMMTDEGEDRLAEPLDLENLNEIKSLIPLSRWELDARSTDIETDLTSPNFRKPKFYHLNVVSGGTRVQTNVKIHHSRIIRFEGAALPPLLFIRNGYWDDSIFSGLMEALRDFDGGFSGVARVLDEFRLVIHKMPDLAEAFANGKEASITRRVQAAAASRQASGTLIADKDEEITSDSVAFGGVTDVLDRLAGRFASHTEYPKIILYNESPEGSMGGNGFSELMGWYSTVMARQQTYLAPKLDQLLAAIFAAKKGPFGGVAPEDWDYEFGNLWQESAKDKADREKVEAETDDLRLTQGTQDEVDIMERRFPDKLGDQDPEALRKQIEEEKAVQAEAQRKLMAAQPKPPAPAPAGGAA